MSKTNDLSYHRRVGFSSESKLKAFQRIDFVARRFIAAASSSLWCYISAAGGRNVLADYK